MKLEVNINKKFAFAILGSILILAGVIGVIAFGTSNPQNFGHSINELQGPGNPSGPGSCDTTKYVWYNSASGAWGCSDVGEGAPVCATVPPGYWSGDGNGGGNSITKVITTPSVCLNGNECIVSMTINANGQNSVTFPYQQYSDNNWISGAKSGLNGNSDSTEISSVSMNGKTAVLCDDYSTLGPCGAANPEQDENPGAWNLHIPTGFGGSNWVSVTMQVCG